ncbi:MAG: energy transducer TonB [Nitrospirota bacterium]
MGIRQNIFISIIIHAMVIASAFVIGGSVKDAVCRVLDDYMIVSLLKEITGTIPVNPQGTKRDENSTSPEPALNQEIASTNFVSLAMTDEGSLKNSQTENTTFEDNKENNPPLPSFDPSLSPLSKGGIEGGMGKSQPEDKILDGLEKDSRKGDIGSFYALIRAAIEKAKSYPFLARKRGMEGTVMVSFKIDRKGLPQEIKIIKSSGYQILDDEVPKMLRKASPFPELKGEIVIPITFKLTEFISDR